MVDRENVRACAEWLDAVVAVMSRNYADAPYNPAEKEFADGLEEAATLLREQMEEIERLRNALWWVQGYPVMGWPEFSDHLREGRRYGWRKVVREKLPDIWPDSTALAEEDGR